MKWKPTALKRENQRRRRGLNPVQEIKLQQQGPATRAGGFGRAMAMGSVLPYRLQWLQLVISHLARFYTVLLLPLKKHTAKKLGKQWSIRAVHAWVAVPLLQQDLSKLTAATVQTSWTVAARTADTAHTAECSALRADFRREECSAPSSNPRRREILWHTSSPGQRQIEETRHPCRAEPLPSIQAAAKEAALETLLALATMGGSGWRT